MREKIGLAAFVLLIWTSLASATLPPLVGDIVRRAAILCDTEEQARTVVMAAQELGWEKGGQVALDDFMNMPNAAGERICAMDAYTGRVTAVVSMGEMPYKNNQVLELWLVSIENKYGSGTLFWSNPPGETEKPEKLSPSDVPNLLKDMRDA